MRLPAKIEYAYKAVLELAIRYDAKAPVQISAISESQKIPKKFLIHLLLRLKNANIVNSSRGLAGGYYLTRPPSRISLADVFKAIDDTIIGGLDKSRLSKATEADKLLLRIWDDISKADVKRLEEVTFDKMVSQIKSGELTYYI